MPGPSVASGYAMPSHGEQGDERQGRQSLGFLTSLRQSSKYSDLIIECRDLSFAVHQCIVFSQSPALEIPHYFQNGKVDIVEHPLLVTKMVDYFYNGEYNIDDLKFTTCAFFKEFTEDNLENHMEWELYEKEEVDPICGASTQLGHLMFHMSMYSLARSLEISGLKRLAMEYFQHSLVNNMTVELFSASIYVTYRFCDATQELRSIAAKATVDHMVKLRSTQGNKRMVLGDGLLENLHEFTHDILVATMEREMEGHGQSGLQGL